MRRHDAMGASPLVRRGFVRGATAIEPRRVETMVQVKLELRRIRNDPRTLIAHRIRVARWPGSGDGPPAGANGLVGCNHPGTMFVLCSYDKPKAQTRGTSPVFETIAG
jgi:hypothetical protein